MNARNVVLGRIHAALAADVAPPPPVPREYRRTGEYPPGSEQVLDLLVDRLVDYRAVVHRVGEQDLIKAVDEALSASASVVVPHDLDPSIASACALGGRTVIVDGDPATLAPHDLDAIDAVVTTARVAIALSGTIILDSGPGQGRRAITLVPDLHVVVLRAAEVVHTVPEAIALLDPVKSLTMISGPSATSDIELERVEGVHGPRTLHVVLIAG